MCWRTREYLGLGIPWLQWLCLLFILVGPVLSERNLECSQTICEEKTEALRCLYPSQILINDVASLTGETDDVMLSHVKRTCLGKTSCDVSVLCKSREENASVVSYFCVQNSADYKKCMGSAESLSKPHGFLQNPDYPAASLFRPCHWRIEPQAHDAVHLRLYDLTSVHRTEGRCDGGLHVTAQKCDWSRQTYTKLLCAGGDSRSGTRGGGGFGGGRAGGGGGSGEGRGSRDGGGLRVADGDGSGGNGREVNLVSCGPVDIRLTPARNEFPLRFWLGYSVTDSVRSQNVGRSLDQAGLLAQCAQPSGSVGRGFEPRQGRVIPLLTSTTMAAAANNSVTSTSGASGNEDGGQDSTMTVLIVLVCVIGFIALVLSVILVIVCIRRRRPKVELIEHVYAVPSLSNSNCQGLSHTYLADDPQPPPPPPESIPRPRLVQAYSDVADARPLDQSPQVNPASPAYAEVEEIDSPADGDKSRGGKRFHFRFRSKRPSVSSTGGMSSLYEDVNPLPVNSVSKSTPANVKSNTLPKNSGSKIHSTSGGGDAAAGSYSTAVNKGGKGGSGGGGDGGGGTRDSPRAVREPPVYVHVVDSADVKSLIDSTTGAEKSSVAPLAAKFIASIDKTSSSKGNVRGKADNSARLYPLQEGRVATLVSTLNRKKDTVNGVNAKEDTEKVS